MPRLSDAALAEVLPWLDACGQSINKTLEYHKLGLKTTGGTEHLMGMTYALNACKCIAWLRSVADMKRSHQQRCNDAILESGSTGD